MSWIFAEERGIFRIGDEECTMPCFLSFCGSMCPLFAHRLCWLFSISYRNQPLRYNVREIRLHLFIDLILWASSYPPRTTTKLDLWIRLGCVVGVCMVYGSGAVMKKYITKVNVLGGWLVIWVSLWGVLQVTYICTWGFRTTHWQKIGQVFVLCR